jgi:hypothetical protein
MPYFWRSFFYSLIHNRLAKVSVVIINFNGRKYLEQFLPSVLATTYSDMELIVADNASTDDSLHFLRDRYPHIRIIELGRNHGYAGGYNEALKQVKSAYYVLLNSDVEVTPGWIEPIIELMEKDQSIAACQPKILSYYKKDQFEYSGGAGGWLDCLGYPFARGRIFDICEVDRGQYNDTQSIFWASGAALFIRSDLFHEVRGFETYFFAHMEEIDLCWRLQLLGYRIYACPSSEVYHVGGGTLPKGNERKVFLNFRNNMIMMAKNLPKRQSFWKIPLRVLMDFTSAFKSLFAGQAVYFVAVWEAHAAFFKWLVFNRRNSVFPVNRKGRMSGWYQHSVAWKHFVEGKVTFDEIVGNKR